mmetsp:Transcript_8224/g.34903  ORF Transcript_8224/g.34903 Transcript_8224/m.34903 type:complete len:286 (+) Transcript_8224:1422-2279(+)
MGVRGGNAASTTSLHRPTESPPREDDDECGANVATHSTSASSPRIPERGSTVNARASEVSSGSGRSHSNGTGTFVLLRTVKTLWVKEPGSHAPNRRGGGAAWRASSSSPTRASSPAATSRPSTAATATSSTVPVPTTRNVFTCPLSHTARNARVNVPGFGGANPTRSFSTAFRGNDMAPGPTRNGPNGIHGVGESSCVSPNGARSAVSFGKTSGVVVSGQSFSSTRRNRPSPPTFLNGTRNSTSPPTSTAPTSTTGSIVSRGGWRLATKETRPRAVSPATAMKSS